MGTIAEEPLSFTVVASHDIESIARLRIETLFQASYRAANAGYLEKSLATLRYVAMATSNDVLAGFGLGDLRILDLPALPGQAVALGGICCVDPRFRHRGLLRELEMRAFAAAGIDWRPRVLSCGRVGHPAAFRSMTWNPTHVPRRNWVPSAWQKEIAAVIAREYRVERFDPETFVCIGGGASMDPVIDIRVRPEEWDVFTAVNRSRGDSLLGLCWTPDAPEGW